MRCNTCAPWHTQKTWTQLLHVEVSTPTSLDFIFTIAESFFKVSKVQSNELQYMRGSLCRDFKYMEPIQSVESFTMQSYDKVSEFMCNKQIALQTVWQCKLSLFVQRSVFKSFLHVYIIQASVCQVMLLKATKQKRNTVCFFHQNDRFRFQEQVNIVHQRWHCKIQSCTWGIVILSSHRRRLQCCKNITMLALPSHLLEFTSA